MAPRFSIKLALLVGLASQTVATTFDGSRYLWYNKAAPEWEKGSLPIGCGRLGATTFGGGNETITITEDTIWSGPLQNRVPPNGLKALPEVRELLVNGKISEAGELTLREMSPAEESERQFSYFGNLNLDFGHPDDTEDYVRWLDTKQGNSGVSYKYKGVKYTREFIASYPADILAARFTSSKKGKLNIQASFSRLENVIANEASTKNGVHALSLKGTSGQPANENPILFSGEARFVAPGAKIKAEGDVLTITGATTIDVFFDAEANIRYADPQALQAQIDKKLSSAAKLGFKKIQQDAIHDASTLLSRASLDLGRSPDGLADLPTDERVANARESTRDIQLATLAWNLGRHLLVGASRDTEADVDFPANLQGVWNNETTAAWGGKYTININTEMNYWLAAATNLLEVEKPLFDLMELALPRGQEMARELYGCPGTVFHHNLDVWGDPAPTDNYTSSTMWPMGAAWLVQHMMDHYRFSWDKAFLKDVAYPFLKEVAAFYQCYTFEWEGAMVTGPSLSPENNFITLKNQTRPGVSAPMDMDVEMDNQLMRDVFTNLLEAATALGISDTDKAVKSAKTFLPKIRAPRIGSLGQIMEWRFEYKEKDPAHRHLSPLYGLHPSHQFSPLVNKTLSDAAKVLLNRRVDSGSGSTGWSRTWLINMYARIFDGAEAWRHVEAWFATYVTTGLWNTDNGSGFQIDGNYGFTSGITEMLLQSHTGVVHILPALPADASPNGKVKGLLARGGFEVDIEWKDGAFKSALIKSKLGGKLKMRVADGLGFSVNGRKSNGSFQTKKGQKYTITV